MLALGESVSFLREGMPANTDLVNPIAMLMHCLWAEETETSRGKQCFRLINPNHAVIGTLIFDFHFTFLKEKLYC